MQCLNGLGRNALVMVAAALLASRPAAAGDDQGGGLPGFRSPSNNIHCMYDNGEVSDNAYPPYVRCDIQKIEGSRPPAPRDCDGEWGRSFYIGKDVARGELSCVGDAVFDETYPVLDYGKTWQKDGFTCLSEESGITCFNARRHGFTLSKANRKLF